MRRDDAPRAGEKEGKAKVAIAARVDGVVVDLARPAPDGGKVEWVTPSDPDGVEILRHSTAHVMAAAVKELFPEALITIGPAIENGFYYDFDVEKPFTPEDLVRIEERMREIVKADHPFVREEATKEQARALASPESRTRKNCSTTSPTRPSPSTGWAVPRPVPRAARADDGQGRARSS